MLKQAIDTDLQRLKVRDEVTTEVVADEYETVLFIKRSGIVLTSIYIK